MSAVLTFSLFSARDLKDLWPTYGSFDETAAGSNEKCVVDFSALRALRGDGGGSKEKDDSVVVPMGGAVCGYKMEYLRALRFC